MRTEEPFMKVPTSAEYIMRLYLMCPVNYAGWKMRHVEKPYLYPSIHWVIVHYERFSRLQSIAALLDAPRNFTAYVGFRIRNGRWPTKEECRRLEINDSLLLGKMVKTGKSEFDASWEIALKRLGSGRRKRGRTVCRKPLRQTLTE